MKNDEFRKKAGFDLTVQKREKAQEMRGFPHRSVERFTVTAKFLQNE